MIILVHILTKTKSVLVIHYLKNEKLLLLHSPVWASHYEIFTFAHMHCYPPQYNLQIFRKVCQCCFFFMDVANPNTFLCKLSTML